MHIYINIAYAYTSCIHMYTYKIKKEKKNELSINLEKSEKY